MIRVVQNKILKLVVESFYPKSVSYVRIVPVNMFREKRTTLRGARSYGRNSKAEETLESLKTWYGRFTRREGRGLSPE